MKIVFFLLLFLTSGLIFSQEEAPKKKEKNRWQQRYSGGKGTFYLRYGWNRSAYTKSDISFYGPGYSFTVHDAVGIDSPSKFSFKTYFSPKTWSIPQFSCKIGYYFADNWVISVGWDHMKYVLDDGRYNFTGVIDSSAYADWAGVYDNDPLDVKYEIFHYENTDGLNYARVEIHRADQWWREKKGIVAFNTLFGFSTGMVITRNDFGLGALPHKNDFAVSGWGMSLHAAVRVDFINFLFLQYNFGGGLIHLPKVNTDTGKPHYARQVFLYGEMDFAFGAFWYITKINRVPAKHIR
ncbi:MAG: hypothetical protein KDC84_08460 [Crocinitomicaceae bacterium]|nr:hypothetical protein [Crocinitomicaceae bacterium]